jgi:hypothetical protein
MIAALMSGEVASRARPRFEEQRAALDFLIANLGRDRVPRGVERITPTAWDCVAEQAADQKIGALTYHRLTNGPDAPSIPGHVREQLRTFYALGQLRNTLLLNDARQVIEALQGAGVPVMVLKGLHLAVNVYSEPGLRTMSDIDVMVPECDLATAEAVLMSQGFGPIPRPDIREFCRHSNHLARLSRAKAVPVEIHWTIERPTSPFTIDVDALWRRAQPIVLEGLEVLALSTDDLLLHLCLHTSYHHRFDRSALKGLLDIDAVVMASEGHVDWQRLVRTAQEWGAGSYVYTTLRLAAVILGTPVPELALSALNRRAEDEALIDVIHQFIVTPMVDLPPGYRDFREPSSLRKRAANVARSIFLSKRHMRRLYRLREGSRLVYLYYGIRVLDLLVRRGGLGLHLMLRTRQVQPAVFREAARQRIDSWIGRIPDSAEE